MQELIKDLIGTFLDYTCKNVVVTIPLRVINVYTYIAIYESRKQS